MPITIGSGLSFCGHALRNDGFHLDSPHHARERESESNGTGSDSLRTTPMAASQRRIEKPRVLPVSTGTAAARMAALVAPALQPRRRREPRVRPETSVPSPAVISGPLQEYRPIRLELIEDAEQRRLFRLQDDGAPLSRVSPGMARNCAIGCARRNRICRHWPPCCSPALHGAWRHATGSSAGATRIANAVCRW